MKKHIFLCETSHDDHYQSLMEKYALEYLCPLGFNSIYTEHTQEDVDFVFREAYVVEIPDINNQIQLGLKNICEKEPGLIGKVLAYQTLKALHKKGNSMKGFECSIKKDLRKIDHKMRDDFKAQNIELLEVDLKELQSIRKARNQAIVKAFYDITSKNESSITMAGEAHCSDFHDGLLKHNISHRIQFISLGSKSLNIIKYNEDDETEASGSNTEMQKALDKALDRSFADQKTEDKAQEKAFIADPNVIKCHDLGHELVIPDQHHFDSCLGQIAQAIEA